MTKPSLVTSATLLVMSLACTPLFAQPQAAPVPAPQASKASAPDAKRAKTDVFAKVNGKPVTWGRVEQMTAQFRRQQAQMRQQNPAARDLSPEELEQRAGDQVVLQEMLVQEAVRRGLSVTPKYLEQINLARESILIRELQAQLKAEIPDAEIRAEFEKAKGPSGANAPEIRARHILVEKEALAKSLLAQIKAGAKFEDLAKKHSTDKNSGKEGGDLDWAPASTYVPEFAKAISSLKKGELAPEPVKTSFGYHIIRVDDIRPGQPAPEMDFAAVEPQIREYLMQKRIDSFVEAVKARSKTDHVFQPQPARKPS